MMNKICPPKKQKYVLRCLFALFFQSEEEQNKSADISTDTNSIEEEEEEEQKEEQKEDQKEEKHGANSQVSQSSQDLPPTQPVFKSPQPKKPKVSRPSPVKSQSSQEIPTQPVNHLQEDDEELYATQPVISNR